MKKLFQMWLLLFVCFAFLFTFGISYYVYTRLAYRSAKHILRIKLDDARRQVRRNRQNRDVIMTLSNNASLAKTRAFAELVKVKPELLKNRTEFDALIKLLDIDELHVTNAEGILIHSYPHTSEGYDMTSNAQSIEFLPAITDPEFELVQDPQPNGSEVMYQYAGVARRDQPGIMQIGYRAERIYEAMRVASLNHIISVFRIGNEGILRITKRGQLPAEHEPANEKEERFYRETVNGLSSLCLSILSGDEVLTGNLPDNELFLARNSALRILVLGYLILFTVIFILVSMLLQKVVIHGIHTVNTSLQKITDGNLDEKVQVRTTPEFTSLSEGINTTVAALKQAIEAEVCRLNAELEMGRMIQTSTLPLDIPENEAYGVFAKMYTAKEVGGDFYDFFMIDETHLAVVIADVSGKGLTAALFMMTTKTLIKELTLSGKSPEQVFNMANEELCRNNQANMFVTVFLAVIDLTTGEMVCINGGHNAPLIQYDDGSWEYLKIKVNLILGISADEQYKSVTVPLGTRGRLFLYTDGVTEAVGPNGMYGETRFHKLLNTTTVPPSELLPMVREELLKFTAGCKQSDDITMLLLDYHLPEKQ